MPIHDITAESLQEAAKILAAGGVIAFPTETVYGLMADATNAAAIAALYALKGREETKPCQVLVASTAAAQSLAEFSPAAHSLAAQHWPGALTLVVRRKADAALAQAISPGVDNVGIRCPHHNATQQLLALLSTPIAASSANPAGLTPATTAAEAVVYFPELFVLDGGTTQGQPSTIVDCTGDALKVLRQGGVTL